MKGQVRFQRSPLHFVEVPVPETAALLQVQVHYRHCCLAVKLAVAILPHREQGLPQAFVLSDTIFYVLSAQHFY